MRAGPEPDEDDLKRSPTAQQSAGVTQVTATSEVIGAPPTLGVRADQTGPAAGRAGPPAVGTANKSPPPSAQAVATRARVSDTACILSNTSVLRRDGRSSSPVHDDPTNQPVPAHDVEREEHQPQEKAIEEPRRGRVPLEEAVREDHGSTPVAMGLRVAMDPEWSQGRGSGR
jgi:hypothetical protein